MPRKSLGSMPSIAATRDDGFLRRAIEQSNPAALRMALYQQTADPDLAAMGSELRHVRGGAMVMRTVPRQHIPALREKAFSYLKGANLAPTPAPDLRETSHLLSVFGDPPASASSARFAFEELAFEDDPRGVAWERRPTAETLNGFRTTIIGAGVSGLSAAIKLKNLGIPFQVIDRQDGVGGTWRLNDYPEARVDISNFVYQYKFEKNYAWRGSFADQAELKAYLEYIAKKYGLANEIRFNTTVTAARWDEEAKNWILSLRDGKGAETTERTKILLSASGLFSTPNLPDIPGVERFSGKIFHTTAWDHAYPINGKRAALIGTGSTGAQVTPYLAREAASLTVFQRTPNWVMPIEGYHAPVSPEQRFLLDTLPYYWNWFCYASFLADGQIELLQVYDSAWQAAGGGVSERNDKLRAYLEDNVHKRLGHRPDLLSKCLPSYPPAARRLVIDNGWFDSLLRPNVELVSEPIARITTDSIVTSDGHAHAVDLIVLGSGFKTSSYLWPVRYEGRGGRVPADLWSKDGARAYLGTAMPGFPNFFMFYGPNGQARAGSFHGWAEITARYVVKVIVAMIERGAEAVDVRDAVYEDYNRRVDEAMRPLIWGCEGAGSYYRNEFGRSGVNMPWSMETFYAMMMEPDLADYDFD